MANPVPLPPPGFDELTTPEKLEYLQSPWDRIAACPDEIPVPEWHRDAVRERVAELERAPGDVVSWREVREAAEHELDRRRR